MCFLHSGHHFDFANIEVMGCADASEHRLARARRAMDLKAHPDQLIDHMLDLIFRRRFLHCDNHECLCLPLLLRKMPAAVR